ncbi:MAG: imidazole glycerol phosphate synthase subunit HisH [Desulfovibrionaceae bacterium]
MNKIALIDYGIGNVRSIANALRHLGCEPFLTADRDAILGAKAVILPGVGAFPEGMKNLCDRGLHQTLREYASKGGYLLGICLGKQLLFSQGEEFCSCGGLGLIPGRVTRLPFETFPDLRTVHIAWSGLAEPEPGRWADSILRGVPEGADCYFVHSFAGTPDDPAHVLATSNYGPIRFCAAVRNKNVYGTQFHPEKSGSMGLAILKNFVALAVETEGGSNAEN